MTKKEKLLALKRDRKKVVNSLKTAVVHSKSENEKLKSELHLKKCIVDHHSLKISKLRVVNNKLKSNLHFEKSKALKTIRDQRTLIVDDNQVEIVFGRGVFRVCKLMRLHVSCESVLVAAKQYESFVNNEDIIHEMSILTQTLTCFPFVFGIALNAHPKLLMEFCGLADSKSCTVYLLLKSTAPMSLETSNWLDIMVRCCERFTYLHNIGIVHCDIKSDIMIIQGCSLQFQL